MHPCLRGRLLSCKLGTQPRVLVVDRRRLRGGVQRGRVLRVRETGAGTEWFEAVVTDINEVMVFLDYWG